MFRLSLACASVYALCSPSFLAAQDPTRTLDELLAFASDASPELAIADARLGLAEVDRASASPLFPANPTVQATVGQRRVEGEGDRELMFAVRQRIELAGERGRRRAVARRATERWDAEREVVRQDVFRRVRAAYRLALVATERAALAEALVVQQQRVVAVAERRAELGEGSAMEARLANVELLRARQALLAATAEATTQRWSLAALVGWRRPVPPMPTGELSTATLPTDRALLAKLGEQPRVIAARARAAEAEAREALARRDVAPEPTLGVQLASEGAPRDGAREWIVAGTLSLPLPLWQRNQVDRARAGADRAIAEAEVAAWQRRLAPAVRQLAASARGARARAALVATELVPALDTATEQLDRAFELGEVDLLTLLAARERLLRARFETVAAHQAYVEAVAALEALLGADLETLR